MKFLAGARGGDVKKTARLLGFAFAADAIDPLLCLAAVCAFPLERRDEKLRDLAGCLRVRGFGIGRQSTLQPGK